MDTDLVTRVRRLSQRYAYTSIQMHEAVGRKAGLAGTDHKYLGFLLQNGQMTAGELAALTGLTTGAVTGLIDRFEKRGLVARQYAENDRRKVIVVPDKDKIMALLEPLYRSYRSNSEELIASFPDDDIVVLETYFSKAIAIMEAATAGLGTE